MAKGTDIAILLLAVGTAVFADVVMTVKADTSRLEKEAEWPTAANAALLIKATLLCQQQTACALLLQLMLQITTQRNRKGGSK